MGKKDVADRQYTDEFKVEAVRLADSVGSNQAAKRLGIPPSSLGNWVRLKGAGKLGALNRDAVLVRRPVSELEAENARLRRELASTQLDLEIVKNVWSAPGFASFDLFEQKSVCVNVFGLLAQRSAAGLDGIRALRAP